MMDQSNGLKRSLFENGWFFCNHELQDVAELSDKILAIAGALGSIVKGRGGQQLERLC